MNPSSIYIIRHGQSLGNVDKNLYGSVPDNQIELSEKGIQQAQILGEYFNQYASSIIYTSSLVRAQQTAELIASKMTAKPRIIEDCRIREQEWGNFRGFEESRRMLEESAKFGQYYYRFLNGESCADVLTRVSSFMDTLWRDFSKPDFPRVCILSTHGMTARVFLKRWFHLTVKEFNLLENPLNCGGFVLNLNKEADKYEWQIFDAR